MDRAELKRQARASLGGKLFGPVWLHAVLTVLVASLLTGVAGTMTTSNYQRMPYLVTVSLNLLVLILGGPISYGLARMFMQQSRDGQPDEAERTVPGLPGGFQGPVFAEPDAESFYCAVDAAVYSARHRGGTCPTP